MDSDAPEIRNRRRAVRRSISTARRAGGARLRSRFADRLEIDEDEQTLAAWAYADIRRADSPSGHAAPELPDARRRWRGWRFAIRALAGRAGLAAAPDWMKTRPAAAALPPSSAGRSRPRFRSLPWCCSDCR